MRNMEILKTEELRNLVPSIFTSTAFEKTSKDYQLYPTIKVVEAFEKEGFYPVMAGQQRVRKEEKEGFQKHILRFRHADHIAKPEELMPEIVLTNSHDGTAAYNLMAGIFRLVCSNGMVVADGTINKVRVVHKGTEARDVINASYSIIKDIPNAMVEIEKMRAIEMTTQEQHVFAMGAYELKFKRDEETNEPEFNPDSLLMARRMQDKSNDLFTVFNRIQENMIKGRLRVYTQKGRKNLRQVNSINENIRLNTALWILTQEMMKIKRGGQI